MTLKELFSKVKFEKIARYLVEFDKKSESCLWRFKQAFDRMRLIPVGEDDGEVIQVKGWSVWSPSRVEWEDELARQVKYAKSTPLSKVAAAVLWELTFDGFDLDDVPRYAAEDFQSRFEYDREYEDWELDANPYRREWVRLWQEAHDLQCRNPKDIGTRVFSASASDLKEMMFKPLPPETEAKLKIVNAQLEKIESKMRRYDLATDLIARHSSGIKNPEAFHKYIMEAPPFRVDTIKAVCPLEESAGYLADTIRDWFPAQKEGSSLVLILCPEDVDANDVARTVWAAFGSFQKLKKPKYILTQNPEAKEVKLTVLTFEE